MIQLELVVNCVLYKLQYLDSVLHPVDDHLTCHNLQDHFKRRRTMLLNKNVFFSLRNSQPLILLGYFQSLWRYIFIFTLYSSVYGSSLTLMVLASLSFITLIFTFFFCPGFVNLTQLGGKSSHIAFEAFVNPSKNQIPFQWASYRILLMQVATHC